MATNKKINKPNEPVSEQKELDKIRLNRFIANAGVCSRREADKLITEGKIRVNGRLVKDLGVKVKPTDKVFYKGKLLSPEKLVYLLLNKPRGYITTTDDPQQRKTVMDLIKEACPERIYPVGRLDRDTTGVLLFTNDGELAKKLSHPSHHVKKLYEVTLDKPMSDKEFIKMNEGIELEDGFAKPDEMAFVSEENTVLGVEIHIGRNRIVRRLFEAMGFKVTKLDRVMYAGLTKLKIPRGKWRFLNEKEIRQLKQFN